MLNDVKEKEKKQIKFLLKIQIIYLFNYPRRNPN